MNTVRLLVVIGAILATASVVATAQPTPDSVKTSKLSNIEFTLSNRGIFGYNPVLRSSGFTFPRGIAKTYLFGSGLWFGAEKTVQGQSHPLVFYTYNPFSSKSIATPGERDSTTSHGAYQSAVYHSIEFDRNSGRRNDDDSVDRASWPLWLLPGPSATPLCPGVFEPSDLDRRIGTYGEPAFVKGADEQFVTRYHDGNLTRYELSESEARERGYPLGLQIQQNVYAWGREGLRDVIIIQYQIINTSADPLFNCVAAQISDPDIGPNNTNDHATYYMGNESLRAAYAWSEPESNGPYGALGIILLEAPVIDGEGWVSNAWRRSYELNGRTGSFVTWKRQDGVSYPITDNDRYDLLSCGRLASDSGAGDQHALLASQRFAMRPGDTAFFAMAYVLMDTIPNLIPGGGSYAELAQAAVEPQMSKLVKTLRDIYYYIEPLPTDVDSESGLTASSGIRITPNPVQSNASIGFTISRTSPARLRVLDALGRTARLVDLGELGPGHHRRDLDVTSLPSGVYVVAIETVTGREATKLMLAH